jgi:hypothetical protein
MGSGIRSDRRIRGSDRIGSDRTTDRDRIIASLSGIRGSGIASLSEGSCELEACPANTFSASGFSDAEGGCIACPPNTATAPTGLAIGAAACDVAFVVLADVASVATQVASESAALTTLTASQATLTTNQASQGTALAALAASSTSLSALVNALTANLAALQSNVTTTLAAIASAPGVVKRTPATAPPSSVTPAGDSTPVFVTATLSLSGYTVATFGSAQAAQLKTAVGAAVNVPAASVKITAVRAKAATTGRRHLAQAAADGIEVDIAIATTVGAASSDVSGNLQTLSAAVLRAAGLVSCTDLSVTAPGQIGSEPADVSVALPTTQAESSVGAAVVSTDASSANLDLLGLLVLLLLPICGVAAYLWHKRTVSAAVADAAATGKTDDAHAPQAAAEVITSPA